MVVLTPVGGAADLCKGSRAWRWEDPEGEGEVGEGWFEVQASPGELPASLFRTTLLSTLHSWLLDPQDKTKLHG